MNSVVHITIIIISIGVFVTVYVQGATDKINIFGYLLKCIKFVFKLRLD